MYLVPRKEDIMNKKSFKHLSLENRKIIELGLDQNLTCKEIAESIGYNPRSISKEVEKYRTKVKNGRYALYGNPDNVVCQRISRFPYSCNSCSRRSYCRKEYRYMYIAESAHEKAINILSKSRKGLDITPEDKKIFDKVLLDGINKGQSIHHIVSSNKDKIRYSVRSCYRLIDKGLTPVKAIDMPRKAKFKPRKRYATTLDNQLIRQGRTYGDFIKYYTSNNLISVTQLDTVLGGTAKNHKCLLTIHISCIHFMIILVLDSHTATEVSNKFLFLKNKLNEQDYKAIFPVVLTDRGSEFSNPDLIETYKDGEKITNLFYCNSYSSYQKGAIEENHTLIRRILPKGHFFDYLTQEQANLIASHINSYHRESLDDTPYNLALKLFGESLLNKLNIKEIHPNDVVMNTSLLHH